MKTVRRYLILLILFCSLFNLTGRSSGEDLVSADFWCEAEPLDAEDSDFAREVGAAPRSLSYEEAVRQNLREAQLCFSGMIYGFTFEYTPLDRKRNVDEYFALEPIHLIEWGDPGLQVGSAGIEDSFWVVRIHFQMADYQVRWRRGWTSEVHPEGYGIGSARQIGGFDYKWEAYKRAVKEAVRQYYRQVLPNKPKVIRGQTAILDSPRVWLEAGEYKVQLRIKIVEKEVVPYAIP